MVIMANPDDGYNDKFDNKIDWLSIPLTSISLPMAVPTMNTTMTTMLRSAATATAIAYAVAGGKTAPADPHLPFPATAAADDENNDVNALRQQVSPPHSSSLSPSSSLTMTNLFISLIPPIVVVVVISTHARLTRIHQVQDLHCELESTNDCLLEVKADAFASWIKSSCCNELIKRWAAERVRLVKDKLRRT
jgi:hypothetical protein